MHRVAVFLDYQNVYMQARRCFGGRRAGRLDGQVDPLALGELLALRRSPFPSGLEEVRVYRGLPDEGRDPRGYAAVRRQAEAWQAHDRRVKVFTRPLRYPRDHPRSRPQEKGVDVLLAVDFVRLAMQGAYDAGILMSHDTDLVPALEAVIGLRGPRCEVAAWAATSTSGQRLRVPGVPLWCHHLTAIDYAAVADPRDYTRP